MTFDQFITQWTGKPVDFDGVYPNQCMDLMHQYAYDVLGVTDKAVLAQPAAYQVYTNFAWGDRFERIANTPTNVPQKGDIVIFGQAVGPYGHVCVFIEGNVNSFTSFDANWPTGSLPHKQTHTYAGVLGWLRAKPQASPSDALASCMADRAKFWQERDDALDQVSTLQTQLKQAQDKVGRYDELVKSLKDLSSRFS